MDTLHTATKYSCCRCQFHAMLDAGDTGQALRLVRAQLTPLTQLHPHLQPNLKVTPFTYQMVPMCL